MSEDALIRRQNLVNLKLTPTDLADRLGGSYSYWRDLMKVAAKSFGEKTARKVEDGLGLPRGWLDEPHDPEAAAAMLRPTTADTKGRVSAALAEGPADPKGKFQPWQLDGLLAHHGRAVTEVATLLPEDDRIRFGLQLGEHVASGGTTDLGIAFNRLIHSVDRAAPTPPWRQGSAPPLGLAALQRFRDRAYDMAEGHPDIHVREVLTTFLLALEDEGDLHPRTGVEATQRGRQPHDN